jgi:protein tyrosine/serine phosphatase
MTRRTWLIGAALAIAGGVGVHETLRAMAHADEKLSTPGVGNFGRMNPHLYRGAQPTPAGFVSLKNLGVDTIVRLSLGEEGGAAEETLVTGLGMHFVSLPWSAEHDPEPEQVVTFLRLLHDNDQRTVFVHCKAGADRTGVMIAVSRIALDHWSPDRAIDEMKAFHYYYVFLPHLQRYVEAFPAAMASNPDLQRLLGARH